MKRVALGVDPSSKLLAGVASVNGRVIEVWKKTLPDSEYAVRADWAERHMNQLVKRLNKYGPVFVFVETPIVGPGVQATIAQAIVLGGTLIGARRGGAEEIHPIHHSRWKKDIIGSGAVKKPQVRRYVHQTWPAVWNQLPACKCKGTCHCGAQDLCDAACICAHGENILSMKDRIEKNKDTI